MSEQSQILALLQQELSAFSNTESNIQTKLSQLSQTRAQISTEVFNLSKEYETKIKHLNQKLEEMQEKNEVLLKENLKNRQDLECFEGRLIEKEKLISMLILQQNRETDRKSKSNLELEDSSKSKVEFYQEQKPVFNELKQTELKVTNKSTPPPPPKRSAPQPPTKNSFKTTEITENVPSQIFEAQSEENEHILAPKEEEEYQEPKIEPNTISKYPIPKPQTVNKRKPPQKPVLYQQKYAEDLRQDNEEQEPFHGEEQISSDNNREDFQNLVIENNQEQVDEKEDHENTEEINEYGVNENFNEGNEITEETDKHYQEEIVNENQAEQESYVENYIEVTEPPKKYVPPPPPRKIVPSKTKSKQIPREFPRHNPFAEENRFEETQEIPEISTEGGMYGQFQRETSEDFFTNLSKNRRESDNMIEAQESSIDFADNNSIASSAAHMLDSQFIPEEPTQNGRAGTESKRMTKKKQNRREVRNLDPDSFV